MGSGDSFDPGAWRGHDFASARRVYDVHVGRSYEDAIVEKKKATDLVPPTIETDSEGALIIITDQTGSMGDWTSVIFSKLGYLEIEAKSYLGEDNEISFGAVGDARNREGETYPLQIRPFGKSTDLIGRLKELIIEGKGGGNGGETYELAALYAVHNIHAPFARRPVLIFIGDEAPFDTISVEHARLAKVYLTEAATTEEVFRELREKFEVYLIQKPYGIHSLGENDRDTSNFYNRWRKLIGEDHIVKLVEAGRVVDVIFGILASATGKIDHFREEITGRQTPHQVATVFKSLETIMTTTDEDSTPHTGKSIMLGDSAGEKAKSLL